MSILELENVNLINDKSELLLENINLMAEPGDVILITGNNGIGKSTLFKSLVDFNGYPKDKYAKIDGKYILDGSEEKKDLNCRIINIHQETDPIWWNYWSFGNTLLKAVPQSIKGKKDRKEYLDKWISKYKPFTAKDNEEHLLEKSTLELSGGRDKYLSVLEGLVRCDDPEIKLVLIDEPTNNLDHIHIKHLSDLIQRIRHFRPELAFIIISHCRVWPYITKTYEIKKTDEKSNNTLIEVDNECHNCFGNADEDGYYNSSMNPSK